MLVIRLLGYTPTYRLTNHQDNKKTEISLIWYFLFLLFFRNNLIKSGICFIHTAHWHAVCDLILILLADKYVMKHYCTEIRFNWASVDKRMSSCLVPLSQVSLVNCGTRLSHSSWARGSARRETTARWHTLHSTCYEPLSSFNWLVLFLYP